ncbi:uncharacterized protein LOC113656971 [Tachysurus fulvidraco]|uniref:uncharacterized protein LOC113656971 n=1 Tax=Tachysurus fulvidraco TaxID=1234273 RepID=UPI000F4F0B83|nr:uncharacterized protein LOC113656971 [Tachysurus fulvidraco]
MEQIMQQSVNEKNNECLESYKKENIFLDFCFLVDRDEKEEYPLKPEECSTEGSRDGECSVERVWCESRNSSMTYTIQCGITSVDRRQVLIQSLGQTIIRPDFFQACVNKSKSERMTIFYYKSEIEGLNGLPVVLKFSDSNHFLKCTEQNSKAVLTIECSEHDRLKTICKNDKTTWPFVFLFSTTKENFCRFESAACSGWFIHTRLNRVYVGSSQDTQWEENTFQIINV